MSTITENKNRIDLVLEGGGVRGIAHVGALQVLLDEHKFDVQNIAGTSAGSVIAVLLAAGYTPSEMKRIISDLDFKSFMDTGTEDKIPILGQVLSLVFQQGIFEGASLQKLLESLLAEKQVETFGDLARPEYRGDPLYGYKVQVIAADITERRMLVLPRDSRLIGIEPDDLSVAYAVRMSTSIPFFFEPVRHRNPRDGREHIIVDGGLLCNYPVGLFDVGGIPPWPTFGLKLVDPDPSSPLTPASPDSEFSQPRFKIPDWLNPAASYAMGIFSTLWESNERLYIEQANFARTIPIPIPREVRATDFDLSPERMQQLYEIGCTAATSFLETWDFEGYKAAFRTGKTDSRRDTVAKEFMQADMSFGD